MAATAPSTAIPIPQVPEVPVPAPPPTAPDPAPSKPEYKKPPTLGPMYLEASALLLLWSFMVLIEGTVRFNGLPLSDLGTQPSGRAHPVALFIGALAEIIFALMGILLGVMALVFRWYNGMVIKAAMLVQGVLGIYVFTAFAIVNPAYVAANPNVQLDGPGEMDGVPSRSLFRWLTACGIFTSIHMCFALLGGQFMLMGRMVGAASGEDFLKALSGTKLRAVFWHVNWALAGFWTFVFGCSWRANEGTGGDGSMLALAGAFELAGAFAPHFPGNVGYMIFVGLLVLLYAVKGAVLSMKRMGERVVLGYLVGVGVVFFFEFVNYSLVQFGKAAGDQSGPSAVLASLTVAVTALGPYFLWQLQKEAEEAKDAEKV
eukprot:GFKZ01001116.1.p1 GENE.GFKZ01001116.1~~GFKZ01001116.1.p1  ORF type:complete len:386 (+),score=50.31 GFKZ01001116.1:41-1159(+)